MPSFLSRLCRIQSLTLHDRYHPHLVQNLSKWSNKIQSVAPSVLLPSNRNAFTKSSRNEPKNAVQLISESFSDQSSWNKMVDRTRVHRGKGERMGSNLSSQPGEHDSEVFDDADFYQQLLRDVIDARNGGSASQDWIQAQKERKRKKVVDTKASKGRKIRWLPFPFRFRRPGEVKRAVSQVPSPRKTTKFHGPHPRD